MTEPSNTSTPRDPAPDETAAEEHDVLAADEDRANREAETDDRQSYAGLIPTIGPGAVAGVVAAGTEQDEVPSSDPD